MKISFPHPLRETKIMDFLLNQLKQKPATTVLRLQNLGLTQLPQIPQELQYLCKKILALNISGNNFTDLRQMTKWLLNFENVEIIITGIDLQEDVLMDLADLENLKFVDDMAMEDGQELENFIHDEKYNHVLEDYQFVPLPEETQDLDTDGEPTEPGDDDYSKLIIKQKIEDVEDIMENLPYTVRYVVINNCELELVPLPSSDNKIVYLDLRMNPELVIGDDAIDLEAFPYLKYLFIDKNLYDQLGPQAIQKACPKILQINKHVLDVTKEYYEVLDFEQIKGLDMAKDVLDIDKELTAQQEANAQLEIAKLELAKQTKIQEEQKLAKEQQEQQQLKQLQEQQKLDDSKQQQQAQSEQQKAIKLQQEEQLKQEKIELEQKMAFEKLAKEQEKDSQLQNSISNEQQQSDYILIDCSNLNLSNNDFLKLIASKLNDQASDVKIGLNFENNPQLSYQLIQQLDPKLKEKIVYLNCQNSQIVSKVENIIQLVDAFPNLVELHTGFEDFDVDQVCDFIVEKDFKLQRLNNIQIDQNYKQLQFTKQIAAASLMSQNDISENDKEALQLLSQLIDQNQSQKSSQQASYVDQMNSSNAQLNNIALNMVRKSPDLSLQQAFSATNKHKQLPGQIIAQIKKETAPDSYQRLTSILPDLYKNMYTSKQQQQTQVNSVPHKFINYQQQDVVQLKNQVINQVAQFQTEIKQVLGKSSLQVPHVNDLLQNQLKKLEQKEDNEYLANISSQLQTLNKYQDKTANLQQNISAFQLIAFERLSPVNKLAFAVQRLNKNQELFQTSSKQVIDNHENYFNQQLNMQNNGQLHQLLQSVQALQGGVQELKNYEVLMGSHTKQLQNVYLKHMSVLKQVQQELRVIKGQLQYQQSLQLIKSKRTLVSGLQVNDASFKPKLNLMTKQQTIKLFISAINQIQNKNYEQFVDFFNNRFFAINFGKKFEKVKREVFYESVKANIDHTLVFAISECLRQNKVQFFAQSYVDLQEVCNNLLCGAIYDVDKGAVVERDVEKKIEIFRVKGIPRDYWENAFQELDENLVLEMKDGSLSWDEFLGAVMVWKMARVGME